MTSVKKLTKKAKVLVALLSGPKSPAQLVGPGGTSWHRRIGELRAEGIEIPPPVKWRRSLDGEIMRHYFLPNHLIKLAEAYVARERGAAP
jgi:hypothetical protein